MKDIPLETQRDNIHDVYVQRDEQTRRALVPIQSQRQLAPAPVRAAK